MKYFDHDIETYKDDKIVLLRRECGGAAVDAYWTLLEVIYRDETDIKPNDNRFGFASICFFLQVSEDQLNEWIEAMKKYGLLIETEDGGIISPRAAKNIKGYKSRCKTNKSNGENGGRPRKTPVQNGQAKNQKTDQKPNENRNETESEPNEKQTKPNRGEKEKEKEKENITPISPSDVFDDVPSDDYNARFAAFAKAVLDMYNDETGDGIEYFDGKTWAGLRRSFDVGRTLDDLRLVVRDKMNEWSGDKKMSRFIRPQTLFGEKFEGYLAAARKAASKAGEFDEYE